MAGTSQIGFNSPYRRSECTPWFRKAEAGDSFAKQAAADGHDPSGSYRTLAGLLKLTPAAILHRGGTALLLPELIRELDRIKVSLRPEANRSAG